MTAPAPNHYDLKVLRELALLGLCSINDECHETLEAYLNAKAQGDEGTAEVALEDFNHAIKTARGLLRRRKVLAPLVGVVAEDFVMHLTAERAGK